MCASHTWLIRLNPSDLGPKRRELARDQLRWRVEKCSPHKMSVTASVCSPAAAYIGGSVRRILGRCGPELRKTAPTDRSSPLSGRRVKETNCKVKPGPTRCCFSDDTTVVYHTPFTAGDGVKRRLGSCRKCRGHHGSLRRPVVECGHIPG